MESFDALAVAATAAQELFVDIGIEPNWGEITIWRLLSGGGWLVSYTRASIILDDWNKGDVAA